MSTYLIVDSCTVVLFDLISAFLFFLAFRLFPWGINQNLSERKKNPTILNMIGFRFIFDARLLIPAKN